jgi:hypothetical protein
MAKPPCANLRPSLESDLQVLATRAYGVMDWLQPSLHRYHELRSHLQEPDAGRMAKLHAWMLVPVMLWPFDMIKVFHQSLGCVQDGKSLDPALALLIDFLPSAPG